LIAFQAKWRGSGDFSTLARIFTIYRLQISHSIVVADFTELQLQHLQHLQLFANLHLRYLQQFWQTAPYMQ
jgi:hypothetical protein